MNDWKYSSESLATIKMEMKVNKLLTVFERNELSKNPDRKNDSSAQSL